MKPSKQYGITTTQDTSSPGARARMLLKDRQHLLPLILGLVPKVRPARHRLRQARLRVHSGTFADRGKA